VAVVNARFASCLIACCDVLVSTLGTLEGSALIAAGGALVRTRRARLGGRFEGVSIHAAPTVTLTRDRASFAIARTGFACLGGVIKDSSLTSGFAPTLVRVAFALHYASIAERRTCVADSFVGLGGAVKLLYAKVSSHAFRTVGGGGIRHAPVFILHSRILFTFLAELGA